MRERDYENLVFSAANLNRPVEKCHICKLDHYPVKPYLLEVRYGKKQEKQDAKKEAICQKIVEEIEKASYKKGKVQPNKEY